MTPRPKRRRVDASSLDSQPESGHVDPYMPATTQEREQWNGFCELESEPALFNVMLREFGVKGVKVQEVVSLDDEMLALLNKPIYGLIFLFRWREDDPEKQVASCPDGIWFANQTASNACATVALLNIVNNVEEIELGENLQHFKDFTTRFTPALRGDAISNFEFVKRVHNSFARKMDILNADLQLKQEASSRRSRGGKNSHSEQDSVAGFHFIAFVPAQGKVWKFDGLERQPQALGDCTPDDWLELVKPNIITRMAEYEEGQIEFSILSLARDPLPGLVDQLARNVRSLETLNEHIASLNEPGANQGFADPLLDSTLLGPDDSYELTRDQIDHAIVPPEEVHVYQQCSVEEAIQTRLQLASSQKPLRISIREEQQSRRADEDYAAGRRFDYGPAVRTWVRFLARKRRIEELVG
ncbi:ubiquitin carboxyl-terminal hydrolase [Aspergillus ambiguus]|uniref:ubiquitin C-terminal hydrolase 37 n=1 Tax=Aspergillus ambiguus TaxID=176160 RepID=UPI003CCD6E55